MRKSQVIPKPVLHTIGEYSVWSAAIEVHDFTVPTGKRWNLRLVSMSRVISGDMALAIIDPLGMSVTLDVVTGTTLTWMAESVIALSAGWKIRVWFGAAALGMLAGKILYEETDEY